MTMRTRAWRRFQRARMIKRALRSEAIAHWYLGLDNSPKSKEAQDALRKVAVRQHDYMAVCSCNMCGNPRRSGWGGKDCVLTMAERRADDTFNDQLEEANAIQEEENAKNSVCSEQEHENG